MASLQAQGSSPTREGRPAADETGVARITRAAQAPRLEDFVSGQNVHGPGDSVLTVTRFRQCEPGDGAPASEPTTAYLSYDDKLYVVFVCRGDPARIRDGLSSGKISPSTTGWRSISTPSTTAGMPTCFR